MTSMLMTYFCHQNFRSNERWCEKVRLVRLVSHGELPGERSGESIIEYSWNNLETIQSDSTVPR